VSLDVHPGNQSVGLPIDQIDQTVQPTADRRADLDALKADSAKANEILAASCPSQVPMMAALAAVENRLDAMRQAVETVRKPLAPLNARAAGDIRRGGGRSTRLRTAVT